jgi:hypothetical protein
MDWMLSKSGSKWRKMLEKFSFTRVSKLWLSLYLLQRNLQTLSSLACVCVGFAGFSSRWGEKCRKCAKKFFIYAQVKLGCHCTYFHETNIHRKDEFRETHVCSTNFMKLMFARQISWNSCLLDKFHETHVCSTTFMKLMFARQISWNSCLLDKFHETHVCSTNFIQRMFARQI